jgi:Ca2+/Na+ antiporter
MSPVVVALLLSPVATELPEILNAIIWVRQGKTQLALANISGAMMIQATVPSGIGLLFTPWKFDGPLLLAGVVTAAAVAYLLWMLRARRLTPIKLTAAAGFYAAFAVGLVFAATKSASVDRPASQAIVDVRCLRLRRRNRRAPPVLRSECGGRRAGGWAGHEDWEQQDDR